MSSDNLVDLREISPLALAFIGDAVYTLEIRKHFGTHTRHTINKLNSITVFYLSAHGQYLAAELLHDILDETEKDYLRKGKNASKATVAKHATVEEYRTSTGLECMLGYLEVTGKHDRITEIVKYVIDNLEAPPVL